MRLVQEAKPAIPVPAGRPKAVAAGACAALAITVLLSPFMFGFRITADQREFAFAGLTHPMRRWLLDAASTAFSQGRIGHFLNMPAEYLAGRIGDMWFFPYLCIAILLTIVAATFVWATTITGSRSIVAPFVVYFAILPAGFHHWLPNSYPMSFLSLALGLAAKALAIRFWSQIKHCIVRQGLGVIVIAAAITYELNLVLLTLMFSAELLRVFTARKAGSPETLLAGYLRWSGLTLFIGILVYGSFRHWVGSGYDGNQLPQSPFGAFELLSTALHIVRASSLGFWSSTTDVLQQATLMQLLTGGVAFAAMAAALILSPGIRKPWLWILFGVLVVVGEAYPVGAESKYVDWCLRGECTYIDSRFILLGLAAIGAGLLSLVATGRTTMVFAALLIACVGTQNYLQNAEAFAVNLARASAADIAAQRYVCGDRSLGDSTEAVATKLAEGRTDFHPSRDAAWKATYWTVYIDHLQHSRFWPCPK